MMETLDTSSKLGALRRGAWTTWSYSVKRTCAES